MDLKDKTRQETKNREKFHEKKTCNRIFWCCSFHETKAKKKEKKKESKKKKEKEGRKKITRERESEQGGGKQR